VWFSKSYSCYGTTVNLSQGENKGESIMTIPKTASATAARLQVRLRANKREWKWSKAEKAEDVE
jgi:hypothetical protein